jgi:hypothetical protein
VSLLPSKQVVVGSNPAERATSKGPKYNGFNGLSLVSVSVLQCDWNEINAINGSQNQNESSVKLGMNWRSVLPQIGHKPLFGLGG